jgi:hypothetical protein
MTNPTCRCGAVATLATVDLLEDLCWTCLDHFNTWADEHPHVLFAQWPGRTTDHHHKEAM